VPTIFHSQPFKIPGLTCSIGEIAVLALHDFRIRAAVGETNAARGEIPQLHTSMTMNEKKRGGFPVKTMLASITLIVQRAREIELDQLAIDID
jgi:hypothetical protein